MRSLDQGHAYVEDQLRAFGAPPRRGEHPNVWLPIALEAAGVRRLRHPGNHRYLFRLGTPPEKRSVVIALPRFPYPKRTDRPFPLTA